MISMYYKEFCIVLIFNLNVVQTNALTEVLLCQHIFLCELNLSPHQKFWQDLFSIKLCWMALIMLPSFNSLLLLCCISFSVTAQKFSLPDYNYLGHHVYPSQNMLQEIITGFFVFYKHSLTSPCRLESTDLCSISLEKDSDLQATGQTVPHRTEYLQYTWTGWLLLTFHTA